MTRAWVWFLGLLLGLSFTVGCDDPTVIANVDNFTCAYLPWWAGDCTSTEVHQKALDVLHNGIVQARVQLQGQLDSVFIPIGGGAVSPPIQYMSINASLLVDGSQLMTVNSNFINFSGLFSRGEALVSPLSGMRLTNNPLGTSHGYASVADFDPATDYIKIAVVDGAIVVKYCDSWVNNIPENPPGWVGFCPYKAGCPDPGCITAEWLSYSATGYNLDKFGITEVDP